MKERPFFSLLSILLGAAGLTLGGLVIGDVRASIGSLVLTWPIMFVLVFLFIFPATPAIKAYEREYGSSERLFYILWTLCSSLGAVVAVHIMTEDLHLSYTSRGEIIAQVVRHPPLTACLAGAISGVLSIFIPWFVKTVIIQQEGSPSETRGTEAYSRTTSSASNVADDTSPPKELEKAGVVRDDRNRHTRANLLGLALLLTGTVNLLQDVNQVSLHNKLIAWGEVYSAFVHALGNHFWKWIQLGWISISPSEDHVVALSLVLVVSAFRAEYFRDMQNGVTQRKAILHNLSYVSNVVAAPIVPILLLPDPSGMCLGVAGLLTATLAILASPPHDACASGVEVIKELLFVCEASIVCVVVFALVTGH